MLRLRYFIRIFFLVAVMMLFFDSATHADTLVSKEVVDEGVRKLIFQRDDGSKFEKFEMCDRLTSAWYEARFDTTSKRWVLTQAGVEAKARIQTLHRRWEREDRRVD